jgi:hypothetical protein
MKADPQMADNIGLSRDIAVPFGLAGMIKAVRVSSITMGRIELMRHEATAANPRLGGHTILKHVGKTEAELRERLRLEPKRKVVSSFYSLQAAEFAISNVMRAEASRITAWARSTSNRTPLVLNRGVSGSIGYGIVRKTDQLVQMNEVVVVLKYERYNGMPYYILTAYIE